MAINHVSRDVMENDSLATDNTWNCHHSHCVCDELYIVLLIMIVLHLEK